MMELMIKLRWIYQFSHTHTLFTLYTDWIVMIFLRFDGLFLILLRLIPGLVHSHNVKREEIP
ncbi:hypothetical protein QR685DRAFT_453259 [Neurospora intermedia]|uniref:Uncharacterized protein n=1 Tax=Neurospora intermedia TaxID=5142 RepID=A0ABR3CY12_NEUIN